MSEAEKSVAVESQVTENVAEVATKEVPNSGDKFLKAIEIMSQAQNEEEPQAEQPVEEVKDSEPKVDEKPAPEKSESAAEEKKSTAWARLVKQEKALREREAKLKDLEKKTEQILQLEKMLKDDPFTTIEKIYGPDAYKHWTERILKNGGQKTQSEDIYKLERKIQEMEKIIQGKQTPPPAQQPSAEDDRIIADYFTSIKSTASNDKYEFLKGREDSVIGYAQAYFEKNGEPLSPEDACEQMNAAIQKEFDQLMSTKYARERYLQKQEEKKESSKTITNRSSSQRAISSSKTEKDRIRNALKIMEAEE